MDITIFPQHWSAILCIFIIIGTITVSYLKKWMITYALIIANFIVFVITIIYRYEVIYGFGDQGFQYAGLGFRPIYLTPEFFPQIYTLITSMFIHSVANPFHIIGNMLIFFFIGIAFEQRVGWKKFLIIYIISGICGAITHSVINLNTENAGTVLIGASGAIFGIMGAFAYSYPRDEVVMPIPVGIIMLIRRIKVIYAVAIFAAIETFIVWFSIEDNTAHFAHLGGLISGAILAALIIRKGVTHTKSGKTIYYDSYSSQRPKKINFKTLEKLATTEELKKMLNKIKNETVPQVKDIWLEHFIEKTACPKCNKPLNHFEGKIWCDTCGFRTNY
jgi:membrane associated rhomboid family serine protease